MSDETSVPTAPDGGPLSSFCAVRAGDLPASNTGALLVATTLSANSEVFMVDKSVAVAETLSPIATGRLSDTVLLTLPAASVVTLIDPR